MHLIEYRLRLTLGFQVTWDDYSIFVHGERVLFYSGEFHPFRYDRLSSRLSKELLAQNF